jgi:hypothetical protein
MVFRAVILTTVNGKRWMEYSYDGREVPLPNQSVIVIRDNILDACGGACHMKITQRHLSLYGCLLPSDLSASGQRHIRLVQHSLQLMKKTPRILYTASPRLSGLLQSPRQTANPRLRFASAPRQPCSSSRHPLCPPAHTPLASETLHTSIHRPSAMP